MQLLFDTQSPKWQERGKGAVQNSKSVCKTDITLREKTELTPDHWTET